MSLFPFAETKQGSVRIRTFSPDVPEEELIWHRDDENRVVRVLEGAGWYFQFDDALPFAIRPGDLIFIPRGAWHRTIRRGGTKLSVEITKCED